MSDNPYWREKTLYEMSETEWEALCDGCARCCLYKLQDSETDQLFYTSVACKLLDIGTCRCKDYSHRKKLVKDCLDLRHDLMRYLPWLPETCAYRRLAEGKDLPDWHPLITGNPGSVHEAGISIRSFAQSESQLKDLDELEEHILDFDS
jgi:uncharacterized cysteine cluster protein YcgN (CxxCxxCC family)